MGLEHRSDSWMGDIDNNLGMSVILNFPFDRNILMNLQLKDLKQCPQQNEVYCGEYAPTVSTAQPQLKPY